MATVRAKRSTPRGSAPAREPPREARAPRRRAGVAPSPDPTAPVEDAPEAAEPAETEPTEADESLLDGASLPIEADEPGESAGVARSSATTTALARVDLLEQYRREIQRYALLDASEEHALAVRYVETQDSAAAARLVTANLRLVVKIAYEYRRAYKNIMDLVQEGNVGLMQAVKRYDPSRGVKLSTYAAFWIRAYILRFILNNWRLVKLGTTQAQRKLFFNLNREKARLSAMGVEPTAGEIAGRLGVAEDEVADMDRRLSAGEMSIDAPVGDGEGRPVARVDLMPSPSGGPDAAVADRELEGLLQTKLGEFRATLRGKDVRIFDERLVAEEPLTLQELGDKFGISRERVRQLESRLTGRLRSFLRAELGEAVEVG